MGDSTGSSAEHAADEVLGRDVCFPAILEMQEGQEQNRDHRPTSLGMAPKRRGKKADLKKVFPEDYEGAPAAESSASAAKGSWGESTHQCQEVFADDTLDYCDDDGSDNDEAPKNRSEDEYHDPAYDELVNKLDLPNSTRPSAALFLITDNRQSKICYPRAKPHHSGSASDAPAAGTPSAAAIQAHAVDGGDDADNGKKEISLGGSADDEENQVDEQDDTAPISVMDLDFGCESTPTFGISRTLTYTASEEDEGEDDDNQDEEDDDNHPLADRDPSNILDLIGSDGNGSDGGNGSDNEHDVDMGAAAQGVQSTMNQVQEQTTANAAHSMSEQLLSRTQHQHDAPYVNGNGTFKGAQQGAPWVGFTRERIDVLNLIIRNVGGHPAANPNAYEIPPGGVPVLPSDEEAAEPNASGSPPDPAAGYTRWSCPSWVPTGWPRPPLVDAIRPNDVTTPEFCVLILELLLSQPKESQAAFLLDMIVRHVCDRLMTRHHEHAESAMLEILSTLERSRELLWTMFPVFWAQNWGGWDTETLANATRGLDLMGHLDAVTRGTRNMHIEKEDAGEGKGKGKGKPRN
ncbi:hypothetical protein CONPUDRAFT_71609 [Coniophora puteana RWD-64-598 SS2]|uniref:Uncharacterized protein n=1 Tax=Coniophora puteana (strain RWD-64-598) TaxID=741705 RepID=A0A5M3MV80_CONPW|nr:uncharacterized protein CONPUDRAFT_71609 [Coniophora puteana RWD-64-598 SS2]EIW82950.1 hypothetical protein CONPUDRAFT_71609 [Coniophora puteana RWD-64-598 SS2]